MTTPIQPGSLFPTPAGTFLSRLYSMATQDTNKPSIKFEKDLVSIQYHIIVNSIQNEWNIENSIQNEWNIENSRESNDTFFLKRQLNTLKDENKSLLAKGGALTSIICVGIPFCYLGVLPRLLGTRLKAATDMILSHDNLLGQGILSLFSLPFIIMATCIGASKLMTTPTLPEIMGNGIKDEIKEAAKSALGGDSNKSKDEENKVKIFLVNALGDTIKKEKWFNDLFPADTSSS
ncbi:MAG: hypothetical protein JSS09_07570 [Verrucomicrobia bacterium]|nr:hypothetical protein [Verrucomicrobiota bacterium]